jgi:signal transduction histidine kinase
MSAPDVNAAAATVSAADTTQLSCSVDELRTLFLFEKLTDDQLQWLCERGHVELIETGPVYPEGAPATCFYVLLAGTVVMSRRVGADDIEVGRTSTRGVYSGAFTAYLGDRVPQTYQNSLRTAEPSRFFVLDADVFAELMREWFPMAVHLLEGLFFGNKNAQQAIGQRERLLALGSLSAGLTHELNNPAAAAGRAAHDLRDRVTHMRHKLAMIADGSLDRTQLKQLVMAQDEFVEKARHAPDLTSLQTSDAEDELTDWLDDHGVTDGWQLAPVFVAGGLTADDLDTVAETAPEDALEGALRWLAYSVETEGLLGEIIDSTARISSLVNAAKQYSQMDRAPHQWLDLHEGLFATLTMLKPKLGGVTLVKELDKSLPRLPGYPAELNQVWTNLIENARDAMDGSGTLTIRTRRDGDCAVVEFEDTGPGIAPEIKNRIFEPFFTTKPVGSGTGLGLDVSFRVVVNRHHGDLRVESEPGRTVFRVSLPLTEPEEGAPPA